jgi:2-C-methyl-D-erythritol 4-phosphate cytidylyltransferase
MSHTAVSSADIVAVLPAAGIGSRMQSELPKQYLTIEGKTLLEHAINALLRSPRVRKVVVAISPQDTWFAQLPVAQDPRIQAVTGGAQRADSVMAGLKQAGDASWVLVLDATAGYQRNE